MVGIPNPATPFDDRKCNMDMQMRFITVHDIKYLPLSGCHLGHGFFSQCDCLFCSELISRMLGISREKTHHRVNEIIFRRRLPTPLLSGEIPQCRRPLLRVVEWALPR